MDPSMDVYHVHALNNGAAGCVCCTSRAGRYPAATILCVCDSVFDTAVMMEHYNRGNLLSGVHCWLLVPENASLLSLHLP